MSYHPIVRPLSRPRARPSGSRRIISRRMALGDQISDCTDSAPAQTAAYDAQTDSLAQNWNPTGYYTPAEIRSVVGQVTAMTSSAWSQLSAIMSTVHLTTQDDIIKQAIDDLSATGQQAASYLADCQTAEAAGQPMYVPDFKHWVIHALDVGSSALQVAYIVNCVEPTIFGVQYSAIFNALTIGGTAVYNAAMAIGKLVIQAGQAALRVASKLFDWTVWLTTYGPPIAIGAGVLYLYLKTRPKRSAAAT